jgi:hypothetical protein
MQHVHNSRVKLVLAMDSVKDASFVWLLFVTDWIVGVPNAPDPTDVLEVMDPRWLNDAILN